MIYMDVLKTSRVQVFYHCQDPVDARRCMLHVSEAMNTWCNC